MTMCALVLWCTVLSCPEQAQMVAVPPGYHLLVKPPGWSCCPPVPEDEHASSDGAHSTVVYSSDITGDCRGA